MLRLLLLLPPSSSFAESLEDLLLDLFRFLLDFLDTLGCTALVLLAVCAARATHMPGCISINLFVLESAYSQSQQTTGSFLCAFILSSLMLEFSVDTPSTFCRPFVCGDYWLL